VRATRPAAWDASWGERCGTAAGCRTVHKWDAEYRHVKSLTEAIEAFEAGMVVRDMDGDWVTGIENDDVNEFSYSYERKMDGRQHDTAKGFESNEDFVRFLVPVAVEPVTDEELAEIARSIAAVKERK
jgi:hypothetical protein